MTLEHFGQRVRVALAANKLTYRDVGTELGSSTMADLKKSQPMTDMKERTSAIEAMARVKLAKYGVSSLGALLTTTDLQNTLTALEARGWQHVPKFYRELLLNLKKYNSVGVEHFGFYGCDACPFGAKATQPAHEIVNDPSEAYYECPKLNKRVWGEQPECASLILDELINATGG